MKKPIIKLRKEELILATTATVLFLATVLGGNAIQAELEKRYEPPIVNVGSTVQSGDISSPTQSSVDKFYSSLNFETMKYGDKTYLILGEEDLLKLIERAMTEVDVEYQNMGATPIFDTQDDVYSRFTPEHLLGLMHTETTFRILEVKDKNAGVYNVNNYNRFAGTDKNGVVYYGLGMMNEETLNYIKNNDRAGTYEMEDTRIQCGDSKVDLKFENLNPYDYVKNSGAKTEDEVKQALAECIMFNAKTTYIYLNRIVKDNLRIGVHDANLDKLLSYHQFDQMSEEEVMMFFAFLGYNQGPNLTMKSVKNNTLFSKDSDGGYVNNLKYSKRVFDFANKYLDNAITQ